MKVDNQISGLLPFHTFTVFFIYQVLKEEKLET